MRALNPRRDRFQPSPLVLGAVGASLACVAIITLLPARFRLALPFASSGFFPVFLVLLPIVTLILSAVATTLIRRRQVANWLGVPATITSAKMMPVKLTVAGRHGEVQNILRVTYAYRVGLKTYTCDQISTGPPPVGLFAEDALLRYKPGTDVTAYYDPDEPGFAVLERALPTGFARGAASLAAIILLSILAAVAFQHFVLAILRGAGIGEPMVVLVAGALALILLVVFFATRRQSQRATTWPEVSGMITQSTVERIRPTRAISRLRSHAALIEYQYVVDGQTYHSTQVDLGVQTAGSRARAEAICARYQVGASVHVHYDPANPSHAALDISNRYGWVLMGAALTCAAIAVWQLV
ncbi:MAG: DUF3592 domain-containing protein [Deltaproteobacteria bacterium]